MRFDWGGRGPIEQRIERHYDMSDVVCPTLAENDPAESEAGDAGAARRALEKGPDQDRDRWRDFSQDDARKLAKDPATPVDAEIPKGGQSHDGDQVD